MASASLTWTPSSSTGVQRVYYKTSSASSYTLFSTLSTTANSETITGLSDNVSYDFKVENSCGGTPSSIMVTTIKLVCPNFGSITPSANQIDFSFTSATGPADITSYRVELLDSTNTVINSILFPYASALVNNGSFTGLTPLTNYSLQITVISGSILKVCTLSGTTTTITPGFYVTNIDYNADDICLGSGTTGVVVIDNTSGNTIVGNLNISGWATGNHVRAGQTFTVNPIPTGDDFFFGGYKGCGGPQTGILGKRSWIQLRNAAGTIVDIDPSSNNNEVQNSVNLSGYGITNGWHIYVAKSVYFLPFRIDNDTSPSGGGSHITNIVGFRTAAIPGSGQEYYPNMAPTALGGTWDVYYKDVELNPFGSINNGSFILSATDRTPANFPISSGAGFSAFVNIAGKSYFLTNDNGWRYGEKYLVFPNSAIRNVNNIGIVTRDISSLRGYANINSVTKSGNNLNVTSTWVAGSLGSYVGSYEFYPIIIKDRGLPSEVVTHYPSSVVWSPTAPAYTSNGIIPLAYTVPSAGTTTTVTIPVAGLPTSYTTLEVRLICLINIPNTNIEETLIHRATLHTI